MKQIVQTPLFKISVAIADVRNCGNTALMFEALS